MHEINVYCDESCHLPNDKQKVMGLGLIWTHKSSVKNLNSEIRNIKKKHGLKPSTEIKWTNVSPSKYEFYKEIIEFFFSKPQLFYRVLIIPDKTILNHKLFNQTHDDWYYKMYFTLINTILLRDHEYNIYLDIKDTNGSKKRDKLHSVLSNSKYDFNKKIIKKIQAIRSHESELMQIADLILGAVVASNRGKVISKSKMELINFLKNKSCLELNKTTLPWEKKVNLLIWESNHG